MMSYKILCAFVGALSNVALCFSVQTDSIRIDSLPREEQRHLSRSDLSFCAWRGVFQGIYYHYYQNYHLMVNFPRARSSDSLRTGEGV